LQIIFLIFWYSPSVMSFGYNVNTSAEHGQLEDNYSGEHEHCSFWNKLGVSLIFLSTSTERHSGPSPGSVSDLSGIDRKTMPDFSRRAYNCFPPFICRTTCRMPKPRVRSLENSKPGVQIDSETNGPLFTFPSNA
jgi:hypothetical protein